MSDISLRQLEYFVAAAETGSITAAASKVMLTQSAVSTAVADLEQHLGVQLFVRHARGLRLTPAGRQALADARRLLSGVQSLRESAHDVHTSLTGSLVVGCYSTLAAVLLPRIIADFVDRHPGVDLNVVEGSAGDLLTQLRAGTCDLALMYETDELVVAKDIALQELYVARPYVLLPEDHPLAANPTVALTELAPEPMILFDLPPGAGYFLSLFRIEGRTPVVRYRTPNFEMVRSLVAHGLGYSLLTQRPAIDTSYSGVRIATCELDPEPAGLPIGIATLLGLTPSRRAAAFADQCRETLNVPDNGAEESSTTPARTS